MITRRTFTAMLAGIPLLSGFTRRPRTEDVCENCGNFPAISRDDPNAFSVMFGDNTIEVAGRYVIESVTVDGKGIPLDAIRCMVAGRQGWVALLLHARARLCEACQSGVVWRIARGRVEVKYYKSVRFNQSEQLYLASKRNARKSHA